VTVRITLLTDFGTADGYAAAVKGVLASLAPASPVDDASHDVPRGDALAAALALERYWRLYPTGTVHVVVVDPGVGTDRGALAVEADGRFVVAPDNGVVSRVVTRAESWRAVGLATGNADASVSATFHGRDVFAPAAAALALGRSLASLGSPVREVVTLRLPEPLQDGEALLGQVIAVDRFGNLITNLPATRLGSEAGVEIAGRVVRVRRSYGAAAPGDLLAVANSDGRVEVAVRDGSAAEVLGVNVGSVVRTTQSPSSQRRSASDR
jgi:hypothetical protein